MISQNTSSVISQIYKSRSVLIDLMNTQGYNIQEHRGFSVNEVNTMKTNNQLDMLLEKNKSDEDTDTLFVIVKDSVNDTLTNFVKHIWESENIFVILIPLKRLQFNILEHVLVPPHRILDESEKIRIKNKYNIIKDAEFPELSRFDPVAQAIGIRPGQVCEISRPSKTAISAPYYRICI